MDWRSWHKTARGWELSEVPTVAAVEIGLLRYWFGSLTLLFAVLALCMAFFVVPFWPVGFSRLYSSGIEWYNGTRAVHGKFGVDGQIRLVAIFALIVIYAGFTSSLSSQWLRVRFSKLWIGWFCCAALLLWAAMLCLSLLIAPSWPVEVASTYSAWGNSYKGTWLASPLFGAATLIRLSSVLVAIGARYAVSSSFGWLHHKVDRLATILERGMAGDPKRVSAREQAVLSEVEKFCAFLDKDAPNTRAAALFRHLTAVAFSNEQWNLGTGDLMKEIPWLPEPKDERERQKGEVYERKDAYLRDLKRTISRKLTEYYETEVGKAATVKFSFKPRTWRPVFEFRRPGGSV